MDRLFTEIVDYVEDYCGKVNHVPMKFTSFTGRVLTKNDRVREGLARP